MVGFKHSLMNTLVLLLLSGMAAASLPPAFPWEGMQFALNFTESHTGSPVADACVIITVNSANGAMNTTLRTSHAGESTLYLSLPPGEQQLSIIAEARCAGENTTYVSAETLLSANATGAQEVRMVPVGTISGTVAASNGTGVPADVAFSCENSPLSTAPVRAGGDGSFSAMLPAGACNLAASFNGESATVAVTIVKGTGSTIQIPLSKPQPGAAMADYALLVVAAAIIAVLVYFYAVKGRGGGKKGGILLALLLLPALASATALSVNMTNLTHSYDLHAQMGYVPNVKHVVVSVVTNSVDGCMGRTVVEISDDGAIYAAVGTMSTTSPQQSSLQLSSPGSHRFYRIRNGECWLKSSRLDIFEQPDLVLSALEIRSSDGTAVPKNGIPASVVATIENRGGAINSSRVVSATVYFYAEVFDEQHKIGEVRLGVGSPALLERGSAEAEVAWQPPSTGMHTLYAALAISPAELEVNSSNNMVSSGFFVEPASTDQRAATAILTAEPQSAVVNETASILMSAIYTDALTQQPILGANCTLAAQPALASPAQMLQNETGYTLRIDSSRMGVGVYDVIASCQKPGYRRFDAHNMFPVNSPGGQRVQAYSSGGNTPFGEFVLKRSALGVMQRLKIRIERLGAELVGVNSKSVRLNGFLAMDFSTDGAFEGGYSWLGRNASYAEWTFTKELLQGETLVISMTPALSVNGTSASSAFLYVIPMPIQSFCAHRAPGLAISPPSQVGEVGTPLYYQVTLNNTDGPECGVGLFEVTTSETRTGWKYELSSTRVPVSAGSTNITFIAVTPPFGEQPGDYRFGLDAIPLSDFRQEPPPFSSASAYYSVSSPRLFAGLSAGVEGNGTITAQPNASADFFARYYDLGNSTIGECRVASQLVGSKGVLMPRSGEGAALSADVSSRAPGKYEYVITCEKEGYKSLAKAGEIAIAPPSSGLRIPSISVSPASQLVSAGNSASYLIQVMNTINCSGESTILLSAAAPAGWSLKFEKDALSVPCNGVRKAVLTVSVPASAQPGAEFISISAALAESPSYSKTALVSAGVAQGLPAKALSCLAGEALESESNVIISGDPCWDWNSEQTYDIGLNPGTLVHASGMVALQPCAGLAYLDGSNDTFTFSTLGQTTPSADGRFSLVSGAQGYRFIRLRSSCLLRTTAATVSMPQAAAPDLMIAGAVFPSVLVAGEPAEASITIRNAGPSAYTQYSSSVGLRDPFGVTVPLATAQTYSHAAGQDIIAVITFTPQDPGEYSLVFTADSSRDITESDEGNNALIIANVSVLPTPPPTLSVRLNPGWNAIPFISGAEASSDCIGEAYLRTQSAYAQLNSTTLQFISASDAQAFSTAHGTAAAPKDALALGGAWYYSAGECAVDYNFSQAAFYSRASESRLSVPEGGAMLAILPWMAENTLGNMLGTCAPKPAYLWNSSSQKWDTFNGTVTPEMAGGVMLVKSSQACRLG